MCHGCGAHQFYNTVTFTMSMQISIATEDFASFNSLLEPGYKLIVLQLIVLQLIVLQLIILQLIISFSVAKVDQIVIFEEQQTVLDIEKEGVVLDSGWNITPYTHPVGFSNFLQPHTAKSRKCQFAMRQCSYLEHIVGNGVVQPELANLQAVEAFPTPTTKKQVHMFLALTGYYRKCKPKYAAVACPLTDLTKKSAPNCLVWTKQCEEAFQTLKRLLCSAPVVKRPDFKKAFILQTDASELASWGCVELAW